MSKKIAILHTSFVFVSVEPMINDLIAELIPDAEVLHFVDSDVLSTVVREQGISPASEARMSHLAQAAEAADNSRRRANTPDPGRPLQRPAPCWRCDRPCRSDC